MKQLTVLANLIDGTNFADSSNFMINEIKWLFGLLPKQPREVLFIPYGYTGSFYHTYFQNIEDLFSQAGCGVISISDGDPIEMIQNANAFAIGGGDIAALLTGLKNLKSNAFDPFKEINKKIKSGTPYIGWNEGSEIASPIPFGPPIPGIASCLNVFQHQLICNYIDSSSNRSEIKNFLIDQTPSIEKVVCMSNSPGGSGIRIEDDGSGMILGPGGGGGVWPAIQVFSLSNGGLLENNTL